MGYMVEKSSSFLSGCFHDVEGSSTRSKDSWFNSRRRCSNELPSPFSRPRLASQLHLHCNSCFRVKLHRRLCVFVFIGMSCNVALVASYSRAASNTAAHAAIAYATQAVSKKDGFQYATRSGVCAYVSTQQWIENSTDGACCRVLPRQKS
jgi:hypothetical protein